MRPALPTFCEPSATSSGFWSIADPCSSPRIAAAAPEFVAIAAAAWRQRQNRLLFDALIGTKRMFGKVTASQIASAVVPTTIARRL